MFDLSRRHLLQTGAAVGGVMRQWAGAWSVRSSRAMARRVASFADRGAIHTSVMLACDVLHADSTIYATGLDLGDPAADVPVGPSCRLCPRRDCADRQEEALAPGGLPAAIRAPLVPRRFDIGEPG